MLNGLFYHNSLVRSISNRRSDWLDFIITMFYRMYLFDANGVDPDQTPCSAASDLYCLQMSHKMVNLSIYLLILRRSYLAITSVVGRLTLEFSLEKKKRKEKKK